jgi:ClpP class serine protease
MPDWNDVLKEIQQTQAQHAAQVQFHTLASQGALDKIRRKYLEGLRDNTGRNVIAYYSGFLSKPDVPMSEITDEDKNGFMMAVHSLGQERRRGLDLILHTPGGSIAATESLVDYLHKMFGDDIRAIVPQIAMSAGTMIACSCREILMARHANLGPIDPHLRGSLFVIPVVSFLFFVTVFAFLFFIVCFRFFTCLVDILYFNLIIVI